MARLEIHLLGGFEVVLDGRPVTDFETAATRALLARLASEPGQPLPRSTLAELLWPDRPAGRALSNLRHSLAVLRRAIGDRAVDRTVLRSTRDWIMLDATADVWVDLVEFERSAGTPATSPGAVAAWEGAVALRRGPFLDGSAPELSADWDAWVLMVGAAVDRTAGDLYQRLADLRERTGEHARARRLVRDWLAVDPWNEDAHRRLVRLLSMAGRRSEALDHADTFVAALDRDLGAEPSAETLALVEAVRTGQLAAQEVDVPGLPPRSMPVPPEPCVSRQHELAWLHQRLDDAVAGAGGAAFVSGEAGVGKTVLLRAFAREARERMPELCVASGAGNAYTGPGDPYLPFRQILGLLCGDLEPAWARGALTPHEASRLWAGLPQTVEAVLDLGPQLLGTLIDARALGRRFAVGYPDHPLGPDLAAAIDLAERRPDDPTRQQRPILDQCTRVLAKLATHRPMLLLVDDVHWADLGTIEALRHLIGQLDGVPILVVAAFRPSETTRPGVGEAITTLVRETGAHSRAACSLELAGSRRFVDDWLDTEPNLLDESFRQRLFEATAGHALFTVETVAAMRQRGDLVVDERGRWIASSTLGWDSLPPRVDATIASRTSRLPDEARRDLEVASVQGDSFLAQIVAAVRGASPADVVLRLGELAVPPHALVERVGDERLGEDRVERYRFRHALIRQFLHDHLVAPDRVALHEATGRAIENLYADRLDDVAIDLALHFEAAGLVDEAIEHHSVAGRRALRLAAMSEARDHFQAAADLLRDLPSSADRDRRELALLTPLGACLQALAGYNAPATREVYERVRQLVPTAGTTLEAAQALGALTTVDGLRARYVDALASTARLVEIATELDLPPIAAVARTQQGCWLMLTGRLADAAEQCDRVIEPYDDDWDDWLTYAVGMHVRSSALAWRAMTAWYLGRFGQARRDAAASIDEARRFGYPFGVAFALGVAGSSVSSLLRDYPAAVDFAAEEAAIAAQEGFEFYQAAAQVHHGLAVAGSGELRDGLHESERGLARWSELGTEAFWCLLTYLRSEQLIDAGRLDEADTALTAVERRLLTGEEQLVSYLAPIGRAALARAHHDDAAAEVLLRRGITVMEEHHARGPKLRAAIALAELLVDHRKDDEARTVLDPLLATFAGDDDTVDVRRARSLVAPS